MEDVKGLIAIPGLIGALTGGSYLDASMMASALRKEPGMTPKHYGMMLAMRHKAQKAKKKKTQKKMKKHSILTDDWEHCFICGRFCYHPHEHHIFNGPLRKISEKYGFKVPLCYDHHNNPACPDAVHFNATIAKMLKQEAQKEFEKKHGHDAFMNLIGRNYL